MREEGFADWLRRRHEVSAPYELVQAQVRLAAGADVASCRRLVVGQMNEVYDVSTTDARSLIVRISREADPRFEGERWALDQARAHGVPTAAVLRIQRIEGEDEYLTVEVQEKLAGTPLHEVPPAVRGSARLADSLGVALAGVHAVAVDGLGYLQADGRGWDIDFRAIMLDLRERTGALLAAADHWGVDSSLVHRGLQILREHEDAYVLAQPVLVHGDLQPAHVLVQDGVVTGIIDFQECSGGHPVLDFAKWHATCPPDFDVSRLRGSYPDPGLFTDAFDRLFALVLLRQSLWMLMVRRNHGNPFGLPRLLADIQTAFDSLADA